MEGYEYFIERCGAKYQSTIIFASSWKTDPVYLSWRVIFTQKIRIIILLNRCLSALNRYNAETLKKVKNYIIFLTGLTAKIVAKKWRNIDGLGENGEQKTVKCPYENLAHCTVLQTVLCCCCWLFLYFLLHCFRLDKTVFSKSISFTIDL